MKSRYLSLLLAVGFAGVVARPGVAARLTDTGIDLCYDDTQADVVVAANPTTISRDSGPYPRQDCRYGADAAVGAAALAKVGAGAKSFDYTKIANNGFALPASAVLGANPGDWACTRDNVTGLTWEVKTSTNTHLRYSGHTYEWFDANGATNGGNQGSLGTNSCGGTLAACQTQNYRIAVNAATLCGAADWRMPSIRELQSLVHFGVTNPAIDPTYFPNTATVFSTYWSATPWAADPTVALVLNFFDGGSSATFKSSPISVRLVRGASY